MSKSTGIVLTATGISFANEWAHTEKPNFRIIAAGLGVSLLLDGIEHINERAGVGLSVIMLITVILTPQYGSSPAETVIALGSYHGPVNQTLAQEQKAAQAAAQPNGAYTISNNR